MALVLGAAALLAVGFYGGSRVRSPADEQRRHRPPPPTTITAPVTRRTLSEQIVFRATAGPAATVAVPAPGVRDGERAVVTASPTRVGAMVTEGDVVSVVAGRPVFVLQGSTPAYRPLSIGSSGPDVAELQAALERLGFDASPDPAGTFQRATSDAIGDWYQARGYEVAGPTSDEQARVETADAAMEAARAAIVGVPLTADALRSRRQTYQAAAAAAAAAHAATGNHLPLGEVAFVPFLPAITASAAAVGVATTDAEGVVVLNSRNLRLTPDDPTALAGLASGASVSIDAEDGSRPRPGRLIPIAVSPVPSTGSADAGPGDAAGTTHTTVDSEQQGPEASAASLAVRPGTDLPVSWVGRDLRVSAMQHTTGHPVLVVPSLAVFSRADGRSYVRLAHARSSTAVLVDVGLSVDGSTEVRALAHPLRAGDRVIVDG